MCCIKKLGKLSLVPEAKDAPVTSFALKSRALGGFFFSFFKFVYLAVLGLDCCTGFSLVASRGYSLVVVKNTDIPQIYINSKRPLYSTQKCLTEQSLLKGTIYTGEGRI